MKNLVRILTAGLGLLSAWLAYDHYRLKLIIDDFITRDRIQQAELDASHTRERDLRAQLDSRNR
jgi:hypothetical protein